MIESTRLLEQSHRRLAALEQEKFYLGIAKEELAKPTPAVYNSIGKVFIIMSQEEAQADVEKRLKLLDEETAAVAAMLNTIIIAARIQVPFSRMSAACLTPKVVLPAPKLDASPPPFEFCRRTAMVISTLAITIIVTKK